MSLPYAEVIGDPIAHSRSPVIHRFWLDRAGVAGDYRRAHVLAAGLTDYLAARRADPLWRGCNVTVPHKEAVLALIDHVHPDAAEVGAVNTIWRGGDGRLQGRNTDVEGIRRALEGVALAGRHVALAGAGGAARAALFALRAAGVARVDVLNRTPARARGLLDHFGMRGDVLPLDAAPVADLLVNASTLGMAGQPPLPVRIDALPAGAAVFDMVYSPLETPLLRAARTKGLRCIDGLEMLIGQAAGAFATFFGIDAPRDGDAALRALLTA